MKNLFYEKRCRYSIRKLSIGACSLMIGSALFASPALAEQVAVPETAANTSAQATSASETANPDTAAIEKQLSETENKVAEQPNGCIRSSSRPQKAPRPASGSWDSKWCGKTAPSSKISRLIRIAVSATL